MNNRKAKISLKFIEKDEETLIGRVKIKGDTSVASAGMLITKLIMKTKENETCKCCKEKESK